MVDPDTQDLPTGGIGELSRSATGKVLKREMRDEVDALLPAR